MKHLQFIRTHFLLAVALLTAGITMSFVKAENKNAATTYYYNSSDVSANAFADASHWATGNVGSCLDEGDRPCRINVPDGQTLSSMLAGKDNDQVLSIAIQRKP